MIIGLLIMVAGGLGAASRFAVDGLVRSKIATDFPLGTVVINVSGSLLLGVLVGAATGPAVDAPWLQIAGTGFLGGYTTFSAASVETVRLAQRGRPGLALLNAAGTLIVTVAAAAAGLALGRLLG